MSVTKKKLVLGVLGIFAILVLSGCDQGTLPADSYNSIKSSPAITQEQVVVPQKVPAVQKDATETQKQAPAATGTTSGSQGTGYINKDGNYIPSPSDNPQGATAQCRDGSYSYSQHRSGTCSHHGGVASWL